MLFAAVLTIFVSILYLFANNRPPTWLSLIIVGWFAVAWTYILHKQI